MRRKGKSQQEWQQTKVKRKYCPDCAMYLDGRKQAFEDGVTIRSGMPGMQFHKKSEGQLHEIVGTNVPCTCVAGQEVDEGFRTNYFNKSVNNNKTASEFFSDYPAPFDTKAE